MCLLGRAFREQGCLTGVSGTLPNSAVVEFSPEAQNQGVFFNHGSDLSNFPGDSGGGDKDHRTIVAITPEAQNQGLSLSKSFDLSNSPQGNDRDKNQLQAAGNLTAFSQDIVATRAGRHVPLPSILHDFTFRIPHENDNGNLCLCPGGASVGTFLHQGEVYDNYTLLKDIQPLQPNECNEATKKEMTSLPTQPRPLDRSNSEGPPMATEIFICICCCCFACILRPEELIQECACLSSNTR